jgi:hypothetical protein
MQPWSSGQVQPCANQIPHRSRLPFERHWTAPGPTLRVIFSICRRQLFLSSATQTF